MPDESEVNLESSDEGPGWMPAIMAATVLMGIIGFVICAFSTWILFQQRQSGTRVAVDSPDHFLNFGRQKRNINRKVLKA